MTARRPALAVLAWIALLVAAAVVVARASYTTDLSGFLPAAPTQAQRLLIEQLTAGPTSRVLLLAVEAEDAALRARLSHALAPRLRELPQVSFVSNGASREADGAFLLEHRYLLSEATQAERYSVAGLHAAIEESIATLASPAGLLLAPLLVRDPTGELQGLALQLTPGDGPQVQGGAWTSRDGRRAPLIVRLTTAGSDMDGQERAIGAIRAQFARVLQAEPGASARLLMSGPAMFAVQSRATIMQESLRLSIIGSVLMLALLWLVYRSLRVILLGMLPVISGALAGVAAVALGMGTVHGLTLGFGVTLIGEAVDYAIYFFVQLGSGTTSREAWFRSYWPTIRLGMLTSVCGFAALLLSGFPGLAQLGLYSAAGLLAAALVTRHVLPALVPADFRVRDIAAIGRGAGRLDALLGSRPWPLVCILVLSLASLLSLHAHRGGLWNRELAALGPVSQAAQELDALLRADMGAPDVRDVVIVSGTTREQALQRAEQAGALLAPLVERGALAGFDSPARFLPSEATQRARRAALPPADVLRARLPAALQGLPLQPRKLEPFIADVAAARTGPLLTPAALAGTSFAVAVESLLLDAGGAWRAVLPLRAAGNDMASYHLDVAAIRAALAAAAVPGVQLLDLKAESDALYDAYLRETAQLTLAGLAAMLVLLMVALRSPLAALRVALPPLLAVLCTAGLLLALGRQFTLLHLVGMLLIVAVGSNYALFHVTATVRDSSLQAERTAASVLLACCTSVLGFGMLAFSTVPVLRALGETVAPGGVLALLFAAALAPRRVPAVGTRA